ncbi:hypothetical protein UFOVP1299_56 [uncultured Caudovirales phage]|uniref:Uncharacterized protein n=1 Tax=uncultured Caudovirales phage TaxID=2100421 RepID=A0A6J5RR52_9CAUD|nr:hypothetical protein UFOVP1299_56 [uncultured Caudovirales phage]
MSREQVQGSAKGYLEHQIRITIAAIKAIGDERHRGTEAPRRDLVFCGFPLEG